MDDRKMGNIGTMSQSNPVTAHGIFNNNEVLAKILESDKTDKKGYYKVS